MKKQAPNPEIGQEMRRRLRLLTTAELANALGVVEWTLFMWRQKGIGPDYVKLVRKIYYHEDAVAEWIKLNAVHTKRTGREFDETSDETSDEESDEDAGAGEDAGEKVEEAANA